MTSLGSLLQCLITLTVNIFFLKHHQKFFLQLVSIAFVLSVYTSEKDVAWSSLYLPIK